VAACRRASAGQTRDDPRAEVGPHSTTSVSVKDPTICATTTSGWCTRRREHGGRLEPGVTHFSDFSQANSAPRKLLNTTEHRQRIPRRSRSCSSFGPRTSGFWSISRGRRRTPQRTIRPGRRPGPRPRTSSVLTAVVTQNKGQRRVDRLLVICDAANCTCSSQTTTAPCNRAADHGRQLPERVGNTVVVMRTPQQVQPV